MEVDTFGAQGEQAEEGENGEVKVLLEKIKRNLAKIDRKLDVLTLMLDTMKEKVEKHDQCLNLSEQQISDTDDALTDVAKTQKEIMTELIIVKQKNEDLEAHCRKSNICIIDVLQSTIRMEAHVNKKLLVEVFSCTQLSSVFVAEGEHHTTDPLPVPGTPPRPFWPDYLTIETAMLF
ncbi:hypothetical protein NDU88_005928 [Pleurodeles waltl]|uniref:Uncharacterized protein n=1 Tax=Pleurodeles waltl TaxID=8319 RepID=A0AAV7TCZ9_PLEWA|nr:hypothetical protein NDU88_005928 [Pleurodeles waltl]